MTNSTHIRGEVSRSYAKKVTSTTGAGCCSSPATPGVIAELAGYTNEQLVALPPDAVASSFGCGNPVAFAEVQPGQVVVDLGSGAGIDLLLAAKKVGPEGRVIGIDMTDEMIERARQNAADAGLTNVEVRKGIIEELPVESGTVDWVISNCVINLSPEKDRVFAEIARVLKPGGAMLVSDIIVEELPDWARDSQALYSACVSGAVREEEYLEGLRAAGMTAVEIKERQTFGADQIAACVTEDDLGAESCASGCCGSEMPREAVLQLAESLADKVWSARIYAEKAKGANTEPPLPPTRGLQGLESGSS